MGGEVCLNVDDLMFTAGGRKAVDHSAFMVLMSCVLRVPRPIWWAIGWTSERTAWGSPTETHSESLARWLQPRLSSGKNVDLQDLATILVRMCFVAPELVRPILAPLYAWAASVVTASMVTIPWSVSFLFRGIRDRVKGDGGTVTVRLPRPRWHLLSGQTPWRAARRCQWEIGSASGVARRARRDGVR